MTGKAAAALPEDPKDRKLAIKQRSKLLQGHDAAKHRAEYQRVCKVELRQAESLQQSAARDLQRGNEEGAKESTDTAMRVLEMAAKQHQNKREVDDFEELMSSLSRQIEDDRKGKRRVVGQTHVIHDAAKFVFVHKSAERRKGAKRQLFEF